MNKEFRSTDLRSLSASAAADGFPTLQPQENDNELFLAAKLLKAIASGDARMGGNTVVITPTITVDTAIYAAGDSIGGKITLTDAMRVSDGSGVLSGLTLLDRSNQKPALEIFIFDSNPTNATITDQSAFAFSTDDLKVIAKIVVASTDWTTINSKATAELANLNRVVKASGSANLYAAIVATGTPDFVAGTDLQLRFKFFQD